MTGDPMDITPEELERVQAIQEKPKSRRDIIIVDNSEEDCLLAKVILEPWGYRVVEMSNAQKAERFCNNQKWNWTPEAVFVELILDGSSGFDVLGRLSERFDEKKVPFVVVSKMASEIDILEAQQAGAHAFIQKPYNAHHLLDALAYTIDNLNKSMQDRVGGIYTKKATQ